MSTKNGRVVGLAHVWVRLRSLFGLRPAALSEADDTAAADSLATSEAYKALALVQDALVDGSRGPEMVVIPAGEFIMGSEALLETQPIHKVLIGKPFGLGKTPVTRAQWRQVMGVEPTEPGSGDCDTCPVTNVSWDDALAFIGRLNSMTGETYRLPTESEWEYSARAGCHYQYAGGDEIDAVAWVSRNSDKKVQPVGMKQPNAWGLYDMSGNVSEWVQDIWCADYLGKPGNGEAAAMKVDSGKRTMRGGSAEAAAGFASCVERAWAPKTHRQAFTGFRVARNLG